MYDYKLQNCLNSAYLVSLRHNDGPTKNSSNYSKCHSEEPIELSPQF